LSESDMELGTNMVDPRNLEQEPKGVQLGVSIKHLHKVLSHFFVCLTNQSHEDAFF